MEIGLWITQVSLLVIYGVYGVYKTFFTPSVRKSMHWAQSRTDNAIRFIGIMELLGAFGMVFPMVTGIAPWLTLVAAFGLTLIQVLAILTAHLPLKEYKILPLNLYFMVMSLFVLMGRWHLAGL
jgi:heme/copper-type cytochrome/quinol oxidase subunit 4